MSWLRNAVAAFVLVLLCMYFVQPVDAKKRYGHKKTRAPVRKQEADVQYVEVSEDEYPALSRQRRSADDLMKRFLKSYKNTGKIIPVKPVNIEGLYWFKMETGNQSVEIVER